MDLLTILGLLGIPTILGTIVPFFVTRHYNKKDKDKEKREGISDRLEKLEKDHGDLLNDHTEDSKSFEDSIKEINLTLENLKNAQQALLRDRIIETYNHYYRDRKYIPIYARESLQHMYEEYKSLDGNGVIDALIERLYSLSTEPLEEEDND